MEGARAPEFRPYWIRYIVAFWAGEKLKWARDNILVACLCSLAPGLIAAGISAALSDNKWRAATYATLLTYAGLFALFLTWRLVSTPFELDRERQRFINGLTKSLAHTKFNRFSAFDTLHLVNGSPPLRYGLPVNTVSSCQDKTLPGARRCPASRQGQQLRHVPCLMEPAS